MGLTRRIVVALSKSIEVGKSGITASYWRISNLNHSFITGMTTCRIVGYVTQEARNTNKDPVVGSDMNYFWYGESNPVTKSSFEDGTAMSAAYIKLKESVMSSTLGQESVETNLLVDAEDV